MADLPNVAFAPVADIKDKIIVVFATEDEGLTPFARALDQRSGGAIARAIEAAEFKPKRKRVLDLLAPHGLDATRLLVIGLGKADTLKAQDWVDIGGVARAKLSGAKASAGLVLDSSPGDAGVCAAGLALGFCLRGYEFKKYKTKHAKKSEDQAAGEGGDENGDGEGAQQIAGVTVYTPAAAEAEARFRDMRGLCEGVFLARDLVNEPANILTPSEFASRLRGLSRSGLAVEVLDKAAMEAMGMGAFLAVSQGSAQPPFTVILRWNGARQPDAAPVVFIGKGVCFDTGGISIKPAQGMEEMKGDMAGAAAVAGAMLAIASRKAQANVIGVVGLVENMPSGTAQRPGDIVVSASGQTVEVLNTDAEGRLVLADLLWYAQKHLNPAAMVTLATLTGAIIVALGKEYAGMFSNNDEVSQRLNSAGEDIAERVWRLPLGDRYDKMLDSKIADMKNIGGRDAGSITAAQFLQRFVDKDRAWAHLDVAGTAMASPSTDINQSWGSGFGVRLLDAFVRQNYES
jgi:leucyl aminopeptidase